MAITIKTKEEIAVLREGGRRLAGILAVVAAGAKPGISTLSLDRIAEGLIFDSGGIPAFKGYLLPDVARPYPASICVSINDEVVHGIPRQDRLLRDGDVVGLDIGMWWPSLNQKSKIKNQKEGLVTDMAVTIGVGEITKEARRLILATEEALEKGIAAVHPGARIGDISAAVEAHLEKNNLGIIRDLAGHGVGYELHEEPLIPNYGKGGAGVELKEGVVIAIEPMATLGGWRVVLDPDEWTFRTRDGSLAAHFEHTLALTAHGSDVLTKV